MKKAILFYNPFSGGQQLNHKLDAIVEMFQKRDVLVQPYRLDPQAYSKIPSFLSNTQADFVVIGGGDGTLNTIVNALILHAPTLPIGLLPGGTCNDFARCLNIPLSLEKSLRIILNGKTTPVDLGLIDNQKYFLSSFGGGMFVNISFNTDSELKKNFGPLAYYLKALSKAVKIEAFPITIKTESVMIKENILLILVLNGKHAAGLTNIDQDADFTDGIMNILLVRNGSPIDLANLFFKVLGNKPLNDPQIIKVRAHRCSIQFETKVDFSLDGEKWDGIPRQIEFIQKKLNVFAP
jgi:diacylglycerol kinase (ATP)